MKIEKTLELLFKVAIILLSISGILAFLSDSKIAQSISATTVFLTYPASLLTKKNPSITYILTHSGLIFSTFFPVLSFYTQGETQYTIILFVTLLLFSVIPTRYLDIKLEVASYRNSADRLALWFTFFSFSVFVAISSPIGDYSPILFHALFAISLITLERQLCSELNTKRAYALIGMQATAIIAFYLFMWTGGGRLLMGAIIMMFAGLIHHYGYFRVRFSYILFFGPFILYLGHTLRYGSQGNFELHSGSVGTPIINAYDFLTSDSHLALTGIYGFADQILLLFFNWFPRAAWENKPIGLGYSMVDDYFGRIGVSDDHSTAPGLIGEAIWFFDSEFIFGALASFVTFVILINVVRKLSRNYAVPVIITASFTANLFWGGLASVGARVWFYLIPALVFVLIEYVTTSRSKRRRII